MTSKLFRIFFSLSILWLLSSCCSLLHGPVQTIGISSQPKGAKIFIDDADYGLTPKFVDLNSNGRLLGEPKDKKEYSLKIALDGYQPYEVKLTRKVDGLYFLNILGVGIGLIIDASNGSMYKLSPEQVTAQLQKSSTANVKKGNNLYIAVTLNPDSAWEKIDTLKKL